MSGVKLGSMCILAELALRYVVKKKKTFTFSFTSTKLAYWLVIESYTSRTEQ